MWVDEMERETDTVIYTVVVMWYIPDALQSVGVTAISSNIQGSSKTTDCFSSNEDGIVVEYIRAEKHCHLIRDQHVKDVELLATHN